MRIFEVLIDVVVTSLLLIAGMAMAALCVWKFVEFLKGVLMI